MDLKFGFRTKVQNTRAVPLRYLRVKIVRSKRRRQNPLGSVSARNIVARKCSANAERPNGVSTLLASMAASLWAVAHAL